MSRPPLPERPVYERRAPVERWSGGERTAVPPRDWRGPVGGEVREWRGPAAGEVREWRRPPVEVQGPPHSSGMPVAPGASPPRSAGGGGRGVEPRHAAPPQHSQVGGSGVARP